MSKSIEDIIKGCRRNDRQCQNLLYRQHYSYGMSIAIRYAKDKGEATGILNDGFMKVFDNIKNLTRIKSLSLGFGGSSSTQHSII